MVQMQKLRTGQNVMFRVHVKSNCMNSSPTENEYHMNFNIREVCKFLNWFMHRDFPRNISTMLTLNGLCQCAQGNLVWPHKYPCWYVSFSCKKGVSI